MTKYIANIRDGHIDHHIVVLECDDDLCKLKERADRKEIEIYSLKQFYPPIQEEEAPHKKRNFSFFH